MPTWPSHNISPPSLLYPPDQSKWFFRTGLTGTIATTAPNGRSVTIVELRGWLRLVSGACNGVDPDWHYTIELDLGWLDQLGLSPEALLLPGDSIKNVNEAASVQGEVSSLSSDRARYTPPLVHIELDGWPPLANMDRGKPAQPSTWTFTNACNSGQTFWPFDPQNPLGGNPLLAVGQYVRVVGSLVTDEPHMMGDQAGTNFVLEFGLGAAERALGTQRALDAEENAVKWLWSDGKGTNDPANPARWNEIHSPDYIEVLPAKNQQETVRCIGVVARNGTFSGDTESITADMVPPPRPSRWHVLNTRKYGGAATLASSVQADEFSPLGDRAHVHVQVQGQGQLGASGKFFAVYRVGWRGIGAAWHATASSDGTTVLTAVDGDGKTMARPGQAAPPFWPSAWLEVLQGRCTPGAHLSGVSRAPGLFDIFHVGNDGNVYTAATSGGSWAGWWQIAGVSAPTGALVAAVSRSANKLDVFVCDNSGRVMSAAWEPGFTAWQGWWQIQNGVAAPGGNLAAVSRRTDYLDIFCIGMDGHLYSAAWQPAQTGWAGWWGIGAQLFPLHARVTALSRDTDTLDVFVADAQGRVLTTSWQPGTTGWLVWSQVLGGVTTPGACIAAVSRHKNYLDLFVVGPDAMVSTAAWDGTTGTWSGWWKILGVSVIPGTPIEAFSPATDVLVVVTTSDQGHVISTSWTPATGWSAWSEID